MLFILIISIIAIWLVLIFAAIYLDYKSRFQIIKQIRTTQKLISPDFKVCHGDGIIKTKMSMFKCPQCGLIFGELDE